MQSSPLRPLLPFDHLVSRFPDLQMQSLGLDGVRVIAERKPQAMYELGLTSWDRLTEAGLNPCDPQLIGPVSSQTDKNLVLWVQRTLNRKIVHDIAYEHGTLPSGETVAECLVAHLYPNVLHLADVEFSNPMQPIPRDQQTQKYTYFRGLGLLETLMERVFEIAARIEVERVTLTAASRGHVNLFRKYGFVVSDTIAGRASDQMQTNGSIPMDKKVS